MANIHQEQYSTRKLQLVSSSCVHSTHFCEASQSLNLKLCFACGISRTSNHSNKRNLKKINLRVHFFGILKILISLVQNHTRQKKKGNISSTKAQIYTRFKTEVLDYVKIQAFVENIFHFL